MIVNLDLTKTYGQQNADIAKKNKINQVSVNINLYPESTDSTEESENSVSYGPISLDQSISNLSEEKRVLSQTKTFKDIESSLGVSMDYLLFVGWGGKSESFPTYYGIVKYKEYSVSIDITTTEYERLKMFQDVPPFSYFLNGTKKHSTSVSSMDFLTSYAYNYAHNYSTTEITNAWNAVDIVNIFDNLSESNDFYGVTSWSETYNINENEIGDNSTNVFDELSQIIQKGSFGTGTTFAKLYDYIQPKITNWKNKGTSATFNITIPTGVYLFVSEMGNYNVSISIGGTHSTISYDSFDIYKYNFTSLNLSFLTDFSSESKQETYHSGNYEYDTQGSMLFTEGVVNADTHKSTVTIIDSDGTETFVGYVYDTFYSEDFANNIYDKYKNGKLQLSMTYPVGNLKTINGLDIAYSSQYGICTNIGADYFDINGNKLPLSVEDNITSIVQIPEGTLCNITKNGEIVYKNSDGSPKLFVVNNSNLVYKGILVNELTLIESSEQYISAFNETSWAEIDSIGRIGELQNHFSVGEKKYIYVNNQSDFANPVPFVILDFNHDELTDGTGNAGMTIGMESVLSTEYQFNSSATTNLSWEDSTFRSQIVPQLLADLPKDLQSIIQPVIKYSVGSNNDLSTVSATEDTLFLQSLTEITGPAYIQNSTSLNSKFSNAEGSQYEYWKSVKDGTVASDREKLNYVTGNLIDGTMQIVPVNWSTRSVSSETQVYYGNSTATVGTISDTGNIINTAPNETGVNHGISYAFCVGKAPFSYNGSLNDATWKQINYIATNSLGEQYFSIGDEKTITLSTGEEVTFVILDFNHDILSDGSGKAGITFGMKNLLTNTYKMNSNPTNIGGWADCEMRNTTMPYLLSILPQDLQNVIKTVKKISKVGGNIGETNTTDDKLWIFSENEISGGWNEGYQYEYWNSVKNGSLASDRVKYLSNGNGESGTWWLRTPYSTPYDNLGFKCVSKIIGNYAGDIVGASANVEYGVCFGFCV